MASDLNKSASKMVGASSEEIEMLKNQSTSANITREDSTEHRPLTEESQHPDAEEGPNVSSSDVPDLPEETGSQGSDDRDVERNSPIANVNLEEVASSTTTDCSCSGKFTF